MIADFQTDPVLDWRGTDQGTPNNNHLGCRELRLIDTAKTLVATTLLLVGFLRGIVMG
ncbi:MAG: hypothetical protein KC978_17330 [Candidatus Omnitrophica bacterium]|nr:hypothetical protein [Candidatus Omnitrophota bacterium]